MENSVNNSWEASVGPACSSCGEHMLRAIHGLCPQCWHNRVELQEAEQENARQLLASLGQLFSRQARGKLRRIAQGKPP